MLKTKLDLVLNEMWGNLLFFCKVAYMSTYGKVKTRNKTKNGKAHYFAHVSGNKGKAKTNKEQGKDLKRINMKPRN